MPQQCVEGYKQVGSRFSFFSEANRMIFSPHKTSKTVHFEERTNDKIKLGSARTHNNSIARLSLKQTIPEDG